MEITVRASATGRRAPELAVLNVRASQESGNQQVAARQAHDLMKHLSEQLRELQETRGDAVDRLAILPVSTRSWRPWNNEGKQLPLRYEASGRAELVLSDFDLVAQLTQHWSGVEGLSFGVSAWELTTATERELEAEVTFEAVRLCRQRAEVMAKASGFEAVVPLQVADTGMLQDNASDRQAEFAYAPMLARASKGGGEEEGYDLTPRDVELSVQIEARFRAH